MFYYSVCGGVLRSDVEFPELRRAPSAAPTWSLRVAGGSPPDDGVEALGEEALYQDVKAVLLRRPTGYRIAVGDTGAYDVSADGRQIVCYPHRDSSLDFARAHLIGRVLATSLHLEGLLTLHGSAVAISDGGVAFVAPKHHGKSTLAFALTRLGAKFLSDDTIPVEATPAGFVMRPGVHSLRLRPDSAGRFGRPAPTQATRDGKWRIDDLAEGDLMAEPVPLAAVYVLVPCSRIAGDAAVARRPLGTVEAAVALVRHAKVAEMLGKWGAPALLQRATAVADAVPVYTLGVLNDFEMLDTVTAQIISWHDGREGAA